MTRLNISVAPGMQHFRIAMPAATHRRPATCADVECDHYRNGWMTVVAVGSPQESFIRKDATRRWRVRQKEGSTTILEFVFESGQECYREHTDLNGREPFYLHETPQGRRIHQRGKDFMEHAYEEIKKNVGLEDRRNG